MPNVSGEPMPASVRLPQKRLICYEFYGSWRTAWSELTGACRGEACPMDDRKKNKQQLIQELADARKRVAALEAAQTERKRVEEASGEGEERLRRVVQNMPVMMDAFDAGWNIIVWNRECERVSGYREHEIVGNPKAMELLYPDADYRRRMMTEWIQRGDDYRGWEWEMTAKDGSVKTVAWSNISRRFPIPGWATWGIGVDVTERKRAEEAVRKEQRRLRRLLDMYERDRKLVAYEIHDGFVQPLTGSQMSFEASWQVLQDRSPEVVSESYDQALQLLRTCLDEARRLMGGLRPAVLEQFGLVSAVENLACESHAREGVDIQYAHDVQFDRLPPPLETAIFRIVQEGLTNACRHSKSRKIRIGLFQQGGRVRVEVEDWGIGFDPRRVARDRFGLDGIRERARLFGGGATIDSAPDQGTRITAELPLEGSPNNLEDGTQ